MARVLEEITKLVFGDPASAFLIVTLTGVCLWYAWRYYMVWIVRTSVDPQRMETFSPRVLQSLDDAVRTRVVRDTLPQQERLNLLEVSLDNRHREIVSMYERLERAEKLAAALARDMKAAGLVKPTRKRKKGQPDPPTQWERIQEDEEPDGGTEQA